MAIVYPLITMVFITFLVSLVLLATRVSSVKSGIVQMEYYQIFKGGEPPDSMVKVTRHWSNLYEAPVLFYIACLLVVILQISNPLLIQLAWAYVVVRCIHSAIHMTYNRVAHRLAVFLLSQLILVVMYISVLVYLLQGI